MKTPKAVIEFQASPISPEEIVEREVYYGRMLWVIRGEAFAENLSIRARRGFWSFRWKWPRKAWWSAARPVFIDLGADLFLIKKLYPEVPCGGWGIFVEYDRFVRFYSQRRRDRPA